jgi:Polyketide cyclase / dehydrase and lipid transport
MAANAYRFESRWRVKASPEEVTEILSDAPGLARWWPQVYLEVRETEPKVYALHTRGRLPYTLRWNFRVTESHPPNGFSIKAWGDLEGTGVWTFTPDGAFTEIHFLWVVDANKPLLRWLSPVLKPAFEVNHKWAMARGEESLIRELERRHATHHVSS